MSISTAPAAQLDALARATRSEYGTLGLRQIRRTDPASFQWVETYDRKGHLLAETDPMTNTTSYTYDLSNNLTKITDASSNVRNFTYDGMNRRLTAEDLHASGDGTYGTSTFTYDNAGNLTQKVDPKSQTVNYTYDALNRPLTEDYTGNAGTEITYAYDNCSNGKGQRRCNPGSSSGARYAPQR